jgi:PKD repeat protein
LVIEAMERRGIQWDFTSSQHARFVKMVLCATASESGKPREFGGFDPTPERASGGPDGFPAGKDKYEGYGMVNADAAVEAVSQDYAFDTVIRATNSLAVTDRRSWARTVSLIGGRNFRANLAVTNGDFDLYLYSTIPSTNGTPVILTSSTQVGTNVSESINYLPASDETALLVIKRIPGLGNNSATFSFEGNLAPAVDFAADPTSGAVPLAVSFTNLTAGATNYSWGFGDGNTSTNANPVNNYTNAGTYSVTLTAVGVGGTNMLTRTGYIVVTNIPPTADFVAAPISGFAPLTVYFTNLSTGGITDYHWDFGDSNFSINQHPTNTYTAPGAYTITLTTGGTGGTNVLVRSNYVVVSARPLIVLPAFNGDNFYFAFETLTGKTYVIQYKDSLDDPAWQTLQSVPGDGSVKAITNSISAAPQRFYRLSVP